jgi:1-acyl-sn-glycerol-3-phosphate acyltransferase
MTLRSLLRTLGFVAFCVVIATDGLLRRPRTLVARAAWMHRWSKRLAQFLGIAIHTLNIPEEPGAMVCNHLSYLDIVVLGALRPSVLVSKDEVRSWPVIGSITATAGTIYVNRKSARDAMEKNTQIADALRAGVSVLFFPEGTSSDGQGVLPFRSALFQPLVEADVPVWPAHLSYSLPEDEGGEKAVRERIAYWGKMAFATHVVGFLGLLNVTAHLRCGTQPVMTNDRKEAAQLCHQQIVELGKLQREEFALMQQAKHLLDRPVQRVSPLHGESGMLSRG